MNAAPGDEFAWWMHNETLVQLPAKGLDSEIEISIMKVHQL